jgi:3-hydroxyacyl-CoA dehydrogenase
MAANYRGPEDICRVAVIGAGVIGAGWVAAYLAHGYEVAVCDPSPQAPDRIRAHVDAAWPAMAELGLVKGERRALSFHTELARATDGADFVQENGPERAEVKATLFADLGRLLPADVIIASSTSNLAITALQAECRYPERYVLGHPFNPVHLMPLVEVGGGEQTNPAAVAAATALYEAMGKRPVLIQREIYGHIANRLTAAMFREAVSLVAQGYATVGDIDAALRFGPALKWAIQGQFTTFHTSGGDGGLADFLPHFAPGIQQRWATMTTPNLADPALQAELAKQVEAANGQRPVAAIARHQDAMLLELLKLLG